MKLTTHWQGLYKTKESLKKLAFYTQLMPLKMHIGEPTEINEGK